MKARIAGFAGTPICGKKLLGFGITEEKRGAVAAAAENLGAECVFTDDRLTPLCVLLGDGSAPPDETYPAPNSECLLIAGLDHHELDKLLDTLRTEGVRLPLKAVYTAHNRTWSFSHLINDLKAEHELMTKGRQSRI